MAKYRIQIVRTIVTQFEFDAPSAAAARVKLNQYGLVSAVHDCATQDIHEEARIRSVEKLSC